MNIVTKFSLLCFALLFGMAAVIGLNAFGQEVETTLAELNDQPLPAKAAVPFEEIKTLEDIRLMGQLPPRNTNAEWNELPGDGGFGSAMPVDSRQTALQKIGDLKNQLNAPKANRAKIEPQLRAALSEYFIDDIRRRVRELDDIKAKLAETEAKIQKRLASRDEAVELQFKLMLREADGLGFFRNGDADALSPAGEFGGGFEGGLGGEFGGEGFEGGLPGGGGG